MCAVQRSERISSVGKYFTISINILISSLHVESHVFVSFYICLKFRYALSRLLVGFTDQCNLIEVRLNADVQISGRARKEDEALLKKMNDAIRSCRVTIDAIRVMDELNPVKLMTIKCGMSELFQFISLSSSVYYLIYMYIQSLDIKQAEC